jgi:putative transposase
VFPNIRIVIADAGHQSRRLARELLKQAGRKLQIVKRRQRKFKITGLTWIVERSFAWLGRNRRLSKDYEYRVQSSSKSLRYALCSTDWHRLETFQTSSYPRFHISPRAGADSAFAERGSVTALKS